MRPTNHMLTLALLLASGSLLFAEDLSPTASRMLQDVKYLASDELEGRGVGTKGLDLAAEYIAKSFRDAGLDVTVAGGDPYQEFEVTDGARLLEPNTLQFLGPEGKTQPLVLDEQFRVCSFGAAGEFSAPIVFAGYGIEADDVEYNDFDGLDINGKVAIILRRTPFQTDPHGAFAVGHGISRHAALTTKLSRAFSRGAAAVLFVNDRFTGESERDQLQERLTAAEQRVLKAAEDLVAAGSASESTNAPQQELKAAVTHLREVRTLLANHDADPLMDFGYGGTRSGKSLPVFHISRNACDELLSAAAQPSLQKLEQQIDETGNPASRELTGWKARGQASLDVVRKPVRNVVGVLEGRGPLAQETIVIGAHYDHLGFGGEGSLLPGSKDIHNGADDNASGTAGLLELARRFGQRGPQSRRLVFLAFTGEERGLLGSAEYVKEPLFPLDQTVAMLNMDMIGRLEESRLTVFGTGTSPVWDAHIETAATPLELQISKKPEGFGPSDHSSFYAKKIPVLHFFTGTHSDYHRPSDDWEKVNAPGMERITNMIDQIIQDTLAETARPAYVHIAARAMLERTGSRPYFGSIPDFSSDAEGYAIQGVAPDSPAARGGIQGGDLIVRFGEQKIGGLDDFDLALRRFSPGEEVVVVVIRKGQEVELKITLAAPRG